MKGSAAALRNLAHRYRNWLSPADRRDHSRVRHELASRNAQLASAARTVAFDLRDPRGDREKGRYAYGLVREFLDADYGAFLADDYWFLSSFHRKAHKRLLLDEAVGLDDGVRTFDLLVTDRPRSRLAARARHVLHVDYRSRLHVAPGPPVGCVPFPYRAHPNFVTARDRRGPWPDFGDDGRSVRVAFLGHWAHPDYDNRRELAEFDVAPRGELVRALVAAAEDELGWSCSTRPLPPDRRVVVSRDEDLPRQGDYADVLRATDFFLACPGTAFPTCHNLVEALLSGCIPLVERPEHTGLPLVDGETCLSFADVDGLRRTLARALELPDEEVRRMRAALRPIVQRCLAPGAFARSLVDADRPPTSLALLWFERQERLRG